MPATATSRMRFTALLIIISVISLDVNAQFNTLGRDYVVNQETVTVVELNEAPHSDVISQETNIANIFHSPIPVPLYVTSPFGSRVDPINGARRFHSGVDLRCNRVNVYAMLKGVVRETGCGSRGLGNYVILKHGCIEVTYAHLDHILVQTGDLVLPGKKVAVSGNSGRTTGPHLHVELKYKGKRSDPLPFLTLIDNTCNKKTYNYEQEQSVHDSTRTRARGLCRGV